MSNPVAQSDHDSAGTSRQSMHHYQTAWMDHWKNPSRKPSPEVHNHSLLSGPQMATNISKYDQGFRVVSETKALDTMNKNPKVGSMKLGKEIIDGQSFPMFDVSGTRENALASNNNAGNSSNTEMGKYQIDLNNGYDSIAMGESEWAYPEKKIPSKECKVQAEAISFLPVSEQLVNTKSNEFIEKNSLAVSASFGDDDVGSSSIIVPYMVNGGTTPMQSFTCQPENIAQLSPVETSKEHFKDSKFCSYSTFWAQEKKAETLFESRKLESSSSRQKDTPLSIHDHSKNNIQLSSYPNKQKQKVENCSSIRLLPSMASPAAMKSGKSFDEHFLLPRIPHSVHDVKTMRICNTMDSVEELPRVPSKFSQTTHQFFITKKTGVNLTEEGQVFRDVGVSPTLKRNMLSEFLSLYPNFSFRGQQGVRWQTIGSPADTDGKDNVGNIRTSSVCLMNESSVETDAMELDSFQKNHLSNLALCPSDQNIKRVHDFLSSETENASGEEASDKMANTELPDMNKGFLSLPAVENFAENEETSTSRTQSLDADHLLSHAEQPSSSKTTACPVGSPESDPSSRWVKRLKLSTSDPFAHANKISKAGEVLSREKVNKLFRKIVNSSKASSEPTVGRSHVRPLLTPNQTAMLLKNSDSTSSDSVRKSQDIPLSHSWIHRWCRHRPASLNKKPEAVVLCEPQSSNVKLDELEKKPFPSIAAMALMGKAMNGFHPCEFRRRGSLIVWNT